MEGVMYRLKRAFFDQYVENISGQTAIVYLAIVPICFLIAAVLPKVGTTLALGAGVGILFFIVAFIKTEVALYLLILSMLLSPEIGLGGGGGGGMESRRAVALRLDDFLLVVMGLSYLGRMAIDKNIGFVGKTPLNKYIGIYLMTCMFSTLVGVMMGNVRGMTGFFFVLKYFEYYVVYFAVINYIHEEDQVASFIKVMFITCFIVSIVGIAQIPTGDRVTAPFEGEGGEPNTLGGYLILMLALNGGIYLHLTIPWVRRILFINFFIILTPLMATGSRGSWIALPFVYFMWIVFSKKRLTLIIVGTVTMLLVPAMMPKVVKDRFMFTFSQEQASHRRQVNVGGVNLDTSTSARFDSMAGVIKDWQKRPIQGYGVTGYRFIDAQYFKILADTGILGLGAFLALLITLFRESYKVYKTVKSPFYKGIAHGFLAGIIGMCAHGVGANTFIIVRIMEPFWFLAGIVIMLPALEKKGAGEVSEGKGGNEVPEDGPDRELLPLPEEPSFAHRDLVIPREGPLHYPGGPPGEPVQSDLNPSLPFSGRNRDLLQ